MPAPPTDEDWAAAHRVAFVKDLEKAKQLVQVIAILQSIEGAHAQAAEGDEEKTYIHMVVYGVFMALLGTIAHRLLQKCLGSSGTDSRKPGRNKVPVQDRKAIPRISTMRASWNLRDTQLFHSRLHDPRAAAAARAVLEGVELD